MQVDLITKTEDLNRLRHNWDQLYEKDPDAQYFLSWAFLAPYLRRTEGLWFILAVRNGRPGTPYDALMPLRLHTRMDGQSGLFYNEINMGGNHAADYTGILCDPVFCSRAIPALAKYLSRMHWAKLNLENLRMSEDRLQALIGHFSDPMFNIRNVDRVNRIDHINNDICPWIDLPHSWDLYLENYVSSNTRQKIRRYLRRLENSTELRLTHADASTLDRDIEVLLELWRIKWTQRKGDLVHRVVRSTRAILKSSFQDDSLFLPILWRRDRPLGALAIFVDRIKGSMLFSMAGRDEAATDVPSGLILHAHSIRRSIEQGFNTYDFLQGNEPYKYSFGVKESALRCVVISSRSGRNLGERLDPRSLDHVYAEATRLHRERNLVQAENAYRQILDCEPRHPKALYGLGQLAAVIGDHRTAAACFETLLTITPRSAKSWLRLGEALQALERHAEAVTAFRNSAKLQPRLIAAYYGLGRNLLKLERRQEALEAFQALLQHPSSGRDDNALRKRAKALIYKLSQTIKPRFIMLDPERPFASSNAAAQISRVFIPPALKSSTAASLISQAADSRPLHSFNIKSGSMAHDPH